MRDLILEGAILLVCLRLEHLIPELRDLLLIYLNIALKFLPVLQIRVESGAVRFEAARVRIEGFFDLGDVPGQRGYLSLKFANPCIQALKLGHQMNIWMHEVI